MTKPFFLFEKFCAVCKASPILRGESHKPSSFLRGCLQPFDKTKNLLCMRRSSAKETRLWLTRGTTLFDNETLSAFSASFSTRLLCNGRIPFPPTEKSFGETARGMSYLPPPLCPHTERTLSANKPSEIVSPSNAFHCLLKLSISTTL